MKRLAVVLALILPHEAWARSAEERVFLQTDVQRLNAEQNPSLKEKVDRVVLARDFSVPYKLEFTNKGNGCLYIGGLGIRFYDNHLDLITFAGGSLEHRLADVDGDGYKDLIFWGTVENWGEKGEALGKRSILAVFRFDSSTKRFINTVSDPALYVFPTDGR
jgi:hypothetical protein